MNYDAKVPQQLKRSQLWFGSIIGRPIDEDSKMNPISPSGNSMEVEAAEHIAPSPTLRPAQRIQIYNQQYWWRLLNTMHEAFPLLTRLFGYYDFNRTIGIPYLVKYPPNTWSLVCLGDRLAQWVQEEYHAKDKDLVFHAAQMDWSFTHSFVVGQLKPLSLEQIPDPTEMEELLSKMIYAQPHLHLFEMKFDVFRFRDEFMKQAPEYWLENDFPPLVQEKIYFFALYRNWKNEITWKDISEGEYFLLKQFQQGTTINDACEKLESQDSNLCDEAMMNLQKWFKEWAAKGWLSLDHPSTADILKANH